MLDEVADPSILLVDDDPDLRDVLSEMLQTCGLSVRTAHHGLDALRQLMHETPSIIMVDLKMPVMDGWDFLEKCPAGIPIVVISGMGDMERTRLHPDVAAVIAKPVTMVTLRETLAPLVGIRLRLGDRP